MFQRLTIGASRVLEDLKVGDSININGACQTVVAFSGDQFTIESVEETLKRTTLGELKAEEHVNLERAMRVGDRLGGHIVSGHVDGVGHILERRDRPDNVLFSIEISDNLEKYIAEKGSIAVDGISLTVASVFDRTFTVSIIPYTLAQTNLSSQKPGDRVNIEVDLLARYIERLLALRGASGGKITEAWLREMGFGG